MTLSTRMTCQSPEQYAAATRPNYSMKSPYDEQVPVTKPPAFVYESIDGRDFHELAMSYRAAQAFSHAPYCYSELLKYADAHALAQIERATEALRGEVADMDARKDAVYLERNQVVAALAKCFPSGKERTAIEGWSEDWHGCVYIDLPTWQVSWHYTSQPADDSARIKHLTHERDLALAANKRLDEELGHALSAANHEAQFADEWRNKAMANALAGDKLRAALERIADPVIDGDFSFEWACRAMEKIARAALAGLGEGAAS